MRRGTDVVFKALGDPTRRQLFERLASAGEQSVHALTHQAGVSQPAVSKHLAVLRRAGLVEGRKVGRESLFRATPGALAPLQGWMEIHEAFWRESFGKLEKLLDEL